MTFIYIYLYNIVPTQIKIYLLIYESHILIESQACIEFI